MKTALQVLLSPRIGGAETLAGGIRDQLPGFGYAAPISFVDAPDRGYSSLGRMLRIRAAVADECADVVIAHSALPAVFARIALLRVPVIHVIHSAADDYLDTKLRLAERMLSRRSAATVSVGADAAERYASRFPKVSVEIIPNGVGVNRTKREISPSCRNFITIARVSDQKNPTLWVEVAKRICDLVDGSVFTWFGPIDDEFAELARRYQDGPVRFMGPSSDVSHELLAADAFFHPAHRENHPLAVLEAAATGLPVICDERVTATVHRDLNVRSYAQNDVDSAVRALLDLVANWTGAAREAAESARAVRQTQGIEKTAERYAEVLDRVTERRDCKGRAGNLGAPYTRNSGQSSRE